LYLDKIVEQHRTTAQRDTRNTKDLVAIAAKVAQPRRFIDRIRTDSVNSLAVITEIKRRSPSRGALIAQQYEQGGASCLSVLTDQDFFGGSTEDLQQAHSSVALPVLRKDFTVSSNDVCDARIMGADCVLLIVAALSVQELTEFKKLADELSLDTLVEVHDEPELEIALNIGASMIGVNQRDLKTFEVDHQRAVRMAAQMPASVVRVAESGVRTRADAQSLRDAGYHAILVGESLVTSNDIATSMRELRV
jgi:indole-3-glycerol phosphate synthase